MRLDLVKILGVSNAVTNVTVNSQPYFNYLYNVPDRVAMTSSLHYANLLSRVAIDSDCLRSRFGHALSLLSNDSMDHFGLTMAWMNNPFFLLSFRRLSKHDYFLYNTGEKMMIGL